MSQMFYPLCFRLSYFLFFLSLSFFEKGVEVCTCGVVVIDGQNCIAFFLFVMNLHAKVLLSNYTLFTLP